MKNLAKMFFVVLVVAGVGSARADDNKVMQIAKEIEDNQFLAFIAGMKELAQMDIDQNIYNDNCIKTKAFINLANDIMIKDNETFKGIATIKVANQINKKFSPFEIDKLQNYLNSSLYKKQVKSSLDENVIFTTDENHYKAHVQSENWYKKYNDLPLLQINRDFILESAEREEEYRSAVLNSPDLNVNKKEFYDKEIAQYKQNCSAELKPAMSN